MKLIETQQTVVVLANAAELVRCIAQGVIGNEVADTFGGSPLTRDTLYNLAQTKFQQATAKFTHPKE
jgi:hypothetical protein